MDHVNELGDALPPSCDIIHVEVCKTQNR